MSVIFKSLEYQNFMSVGNVPIKIDLNKHKTTLISGENGSGKTTVLSALCFALFGKAYGSINKPGLVNSINQKKCLVSVEFSIGKKDYKIVRGIKPNVFEIYENGNLKNQDPDVRDYQKVLEQQILKFNYRAFTQVVMVGGGDTYTPFMKLSTRDRREFVEDLLDIRIFSVMNLTIKDQVKVVRDSIKDVDSSILSQREKIELQNSFIKKLESNKEASTDKLLETIASLQDSLNAMQHEVDEKTKNAELLRHFVDEYREQNDKVSYELEPRINQARSELRKLREKRDYHGDMDSCPSCNQAIDSSRKSAVLASLDSDIERVIKELETLTSKKQDAELDVKVLRVHVDDFNRISNEINAINMNIFATNVAIKSTNKQVSELNVDSSNIDAEKDKLKLFAEEYLKLDKKKKQLLSAQQYYDYIQQILADSGIKSKIIKQYVPTINKLINKYLSDLDFFVSFYLDENFDETIKSRHRDTFKYDNFSDGQKRRIDLAILLTWMEIAKAKNALHTNVAFFDEIDAPLDASGSDMLHAALKSCSSENVFIISHKGDVLADKVDNVIRFRIHNNFTEIVKD